MREPTANALAATDAYGQTSFHVRRILHQPDEESWLWLVQRINPLLELQASYRLRDPARRLCDVEDLINETWLVAFMRLGTLRARDGRWTPVLLEFLSTTLLHKVNDVLRRELHRRAQPLVDGNARPSQDIELRGATSALSRAARSEHENALRAALARLAPAEQEVVVLRGVEQRPNHQVAAMLGQKPSAVAMRWSRALKHLREVLPGSLFQELSDE
jgi:RNA polymerase sigma factor (sigma-70 family)